MTDLPKHATEHARLGRTTRRHALKVIAASVAMGGAALALGSIAHQRGYHSWAGESLGGPASLTLFGANERDAQRTIIRMRAEVERLEAVFSLFQAGSEISRLNRAGKLARPSPDLVTVLSESHAVAEISAGAFDPTVQPLWRLYEDHFRRNPEDAQGPAPNEIALARSLVDYQQVYVGPAAILLGRPGMAVTLNGIAQGYITDRIADLLQQEGYQHAVVEVGETRALGPSPEGPPWRIGLQNPRDRLLVDRSVELSDQALSVSGGYGLRWGRSDFSHIFDPQTGRSPAQLLDVAVIAPRATVADVLSTAIFVAGEVAARKLLARYPGARAIMTRLDGSSASA